MKSKKKSSFRKFVTAFILLAILGCVGMVYELYSRVYQPNVVLPDNTEKYIYIPSNSEFSDVVKVLSENGLLINANSFEWLARQKKYDTNIKAGRYRINRAVNNNDLVNLLRSGKQTPIKVTFNNLRNKEQLAGKIASQIEADSLSIIKYITDTTFLNKLKLNTDNVACLFIPNTYEFYWNTSVEGFVNRMVKEYSDFWNSNRKKKAAEIKFNYYQVAVLASIVEKEQSIKKDERPEIAGLYLNRLKKRMKLESDPTLIFALGDFTIKRVLNKDKKVDSPYNTYKNKGLPPGPICIPSINAIDAVLNASEHNYIFMCAKEDFTGYHNFAKTYAKHLINARKYQKALNKREIMR
ncbi:MAG: endolytic transglycosylase MltG [Flavobacteriales bacterium]|nr:endolytic transglycosylase MltG [Flavobacteriales bacterium]MBT5750730.1 endolytic transglycosylase MltG [Flavobacteriales bacterium]